MTFRTNVAPTTAITLLSAAIATSQGPNMVCSYDANSPEAAFGPADAGDIGRIDAHPTDAGWMRYSSADLGLFQGAEVDAVCHGLAMFDGAQNAQQFQMGLCFSVDRSSAGVTGGAVHLETTFNGAACDVFRIDWPGGTPSVGLAIDCPQLTQTTGASQTDIDAIRFEYGYPVYYSVTDATAVALSAMLGHGVTGADILVVDAPGATPEVFASAEELGLLPEDEIDALVMGPEGYLLSLTRTSPTAIAHPAVGGAGLFYNGGDVWATASDMELLPTDQLNALEAETFEPLYRHTPLMPGHIAHFRCDSMNPGDTAYFLASFQQPFPICVPGIVCLDILPEVTLGTAIAGADGTARISLRLAETTPMIMLNTQAVVLTPQFNLIAMNPMLASVRGTWGWQILTQGNATNGYTIDGGRGNYRLLLRGVTDSSGTLLNGSRPVTLYYTKNGVPQTPRKVWVTFTNGNATYGTGVGVTHTLQVTGLGVSLRPGE